MIDPMLAVLGATEPAADYAEELALFGQFVGVGDIDSRRWAPDGSELSQTRAVWTFGSALRGRAIIDVLEGPDVLGTTVRMLHPGRGEWTVIWHSALSQRHFVMAACRRSAAPPVLPGSPAQPTPAFAASPAEAAVASSASALKARNPFTPSLA